MSANSADFARAYQCRSELRLPIRICEMLDYQQLVIKQQFSPKRRSFSSLCQSTKKKKRYFIDDQFISAFSRMTLEEKNKLYVKSVEYLKLIFERTEPRIVIENDSFSKVLIESGIFGSTWVEVNLRLNAELCTIEIRGKMEAVIDLHEYLIRRSSDWRKHAFVLQAIKPGFTEAFRFGFNDQVSCEKCYQAISCLVDKCIFQAYRKQVHGLKQFKLDFEEGEQNNNKLVASKQRDNRVEEMDNLLASYIQQELKEFCLSCGQLTVNEFSQKFQISSTSNSAIIEYQTFPGEYSEEALYNDSNYLPTKEYPEMLYQLKSDPAVFRLNKMYECSIEEIINALSDTQCFERWNQQVKTATVISYIKEANSIVVSEVHKPLVKYYEPRVFSYLRTLFRKGDAVYIVDKPLTCKKEDGSSREKQFDHFVKGVEVFEVWKLVPKSNGRTFVDVITKLDHKIIKNKEIEIRLTGIYMEGLLHLDQYLQHNAQRAVSIFNLRYRLQDYKKSNKQMFKREEVPVRMLESYILSRNQAEIKSHHPTTTVRIEDDSFYSVAGMSDWNSKAASVFSRKSTTRDSKKERNHKTIKFLEDITPISQLPSSINVSNESKQERSHMIIKEKESQKHNVHTAPPPPQQIKILKQSSPLIVSKPLNYYQTERVGADQPQKSLIQSGSNLSTQSIIKDDQYQYHICEKVMPQQNKDGMAIIPQHHLNPARPYPMKPKKAYPWKNLTDKEWSHYFLKNLWQITPLGEFKCVNQKLIDIQSGVLKLVVKRIAANVMSGKGFNLSLPVQLFDDKSGLEIAARGISLAPKFFERAAQTKDPLQRFKITMSFHIGMLITFMQMSKPFDPILGQTYQGWINGCPFYGEQVSHHPPTSYYIFYGRGYKIYGSITPEAHINMNSAVAYNHGFTTVQFEDDPDHKIHMVNPGGQIFGVTYGDRKLLWTGKSFCFDSLGYYCELQHNPYKKSMFSLGKQTKPVDIVETKVYKMDKIHTIEFRKKYTKNGIDKSLLKNPVSTVSGRITQQIKFDDVVYFSVKNDQPCSYEQQAYPLPSNSNYREDILFKSRGEEDLAQQNKHRLEEIQRRDKRLRLKQQK